MSKLLDFRSNKYQIDSAFSNLLCRLRFCLRGTVKARIFLFKASCGLGKSTAIQSFLREWKADGFKPGEGVLIVLPTLEEIEAYILRTDLHSTDYAVVVSDKALASKGRGMTDAGEAPVVYTTHEMFKRRVTWKKDKWGRGFKAATCFHYRGKPRSLVIYDETLHRAQEIALGLDTVATLPDVIRPIDPVVTAMIEEAIPGKGVLDYNLPVVLPADLADGLTAVRTKLELLLSLKAMKVVDSLIAAAGSTLTAQRDKQGGWHLVGSCRPLPTDMPHTVVLDGSIGLRATYDLWAQHDERVRFLRPATADYRPLTLEWWDRGGSKSTLGAFDHRHQILTAIADEINRYAHEPWLIIHPKDRDGANGFAVPREMQKVLAKPENVKFLHWGLHTATNKYRGATRVVLIGENMYRDEGYDAHCMAATGRSYVGKHDRQAVRIGEFAHHVYQAICRSNVRQVLDGVAGSATAYLITPWGEDKEAKLREALPGCTINLWQPVEPKPPTKAERLIVELENVFQKANRNEITLRELALRCGGKDGKYLTRQWADPAVVNWLSTHDFEKTNKVIRRIISAA